MAEGQRPIAELPNALERARRGGRGGGAEGAPRRAQVDARQDGVRDPAEDRLGQGQGRPPSAPRTGLDGDDVVPIYLGDDITDEDGFKALAGRGIGVFVGRPDDPEVAGRTTWADYVLPSIEDVERFLYALGRWVPARPTAESQQSSESKHVGNGQ